MPRDLPDWGILSAQDKAHEVTDLGELAVRLGSIDSFDRRGDVFWFDSFKDGLGRWNPATSGTGAAVDLSTVSNRSGFYAARLKAGSSDGHLASMQSRSPMPALGSIGFEFSYNDAGNFDSIDVTFLIYTGTILYWPGLRYLSSTEALQYVDDTGAWVDIVTGVDLFNVADLFHTLKLVVNLSAGEYVRLIADSSEHDLSGIAMRSTVDPTGPYIDFTIKNTGRNIFNDVAYIEDVIITQNEPAQAAA